MALYAFLCSIDPAKLELFGRLRAEHYAFLLAQRDRIRFGGPTRADARGVPETMIIIAQATDQADAEAWISGEPYNAHGGFAQVTVRLWNQVLPEPQRGALQATLDAERASAS